MTRNLGQRRPTAAGSAIALVRLERRMRDSVARMREQQVAVLRGALAVAATAPLHRPALAGVDLARFGLEDLPALPVTSKSDMLALPDDQRLTGAVPPGSRVLSTSGSTGEPFVVSYAPRAAWFQGVLTLRTSRARGISLLAGVAAFSMADGPRPRKKGLARIRERRRYLLNASRPIGDAAAIVLERRPAVLGGHGHLLVELGEALAGSRYRPRAVVTSGELLTAENRDALRSLFGVEPVDTYGTAECGQVAWQCGAADLYHVNHEAVVAEVVDADGNGCPPGIAGDLVLTSLWNPLMPFVRYRIGDGAVWADRACRCGVALPAFEVVHGRVMDWFVDDHGRRVPPQRLWLSVHINLADVRAIRRYRVRQAPDGAVALEIVTDDPGSIPVGEITASYQRLLGAGTPVTVMFVEQLALDPSGKFRAITSERSAVRT